MDKLPFIPGQFYKRVEIHSKYGGNPQSGISSSAKTPYIFIFSGSSGHQHGYNDGWDNENIFFYSGEGQVGDMKFTKGNLALREHLTRGKRVFLFETGKKGAPVKFNCELEFYDTGFLQTPDRNGNMRQGITFFFKRKGAYIPVSPDILNESAKVAESLPEYKLPIETERTGLVISRVGQDIFRKRTVHRWKYKCAVTEFDRLDLLVASHIVPWKESNNDDRLNPDNGILLSPTYDALFDRHLITFENTGKIILSDKIESQAFQKIGVSGNEKIKSFSEYNFSYLEKHRFKFNEIH